MRGGEESSTAATGEAGERPHAPWPPFAYSARPYRARWELPGGARVAFYLAPNIEHFEPDRPAISLFGATAGLSPDPLNHGWRDYGVRAGVWRVIDVLDRRSLRASAPINSACCERYPEIVERGRERDWCWIAHGRDNSTLHTGLEEAEERALLTEIVDTIEHATGRRPRGWLGPALTETHNTPRLLSELGLSYVMDFTNDDEPYPLDVEPGPMIALPYLSEVSDIPIFLLRGGTAEEFAATAIAHFDRLYEEGDERTAVMGLGVHPFLIGQPSRIGALEQVLDHVLSRREVWVATSDEIADWYLTVKPHSAHPGESAPPSHPANPAHPSNSAHPAHPTDPGRSG